MLRFRIKKNIAVMLLSVFLSVSSVNAQVILYGFVRVSGYVYNESNNLPLANVQVRGCSAYGCSIITTNSQGFYDFGLTLAGSAFPTVPIEISLPGRYIYGYSRLESTIRYSDPCDDYTSIPSRSVSPIEKVSWSYGSTIHTGVCLSILGGPIPVSSLTFTADNYSLPHNASTTLRWTSSAMARCYAWSGPWSGLGQIDLNGTYNTGTLAGPASYTFGIRCYEISSLGGDTFNRSVTVNVAAAAPPMVDIRANNSNGPLSLLYGSSANLSWTTTNVNSCTASGSWSGGKSTSGSQSTGSLTAASYTYTLTCTNSSSGLSASDSVVVNTTNSNPTGSFTSASCDTGQIVVTGSASDPDGGGPVQLRIYLDYPGGLVTQTVNNNPAVNRFTFSYPRNVGTHNTRVYARDNQKGAWVQIGGQLSYACYEPIAITDPCPECGEPQINFTFDAVPGVCS